MNETFTEFLNGMQADPDMIQQALRIYLSERTNDLTHKEMLTELGETVTSEEELDQLLKQLEHDPDALEQAALIHFEHAWEDEAQRPSIRAAFEYAKGRLPVIEMTILAVVAMYGMYLIATEGGLTEITVKKNPDGSYEKTEKREPFVPIVSAMARLFGKGG
jgi:hypothetical protein